MAALRFSGERLREACTTRGVTAPVLAQRAGCSPSAVYKWRRGWSRPGADELAAVAVALGVPLESLFVPAVGDCQAASAQVA